VLSGSQTRKGTLQEVCEHLGRSLRHIFQDLGRRAVEEDDIDDFDSAVGCRCCALLLEMVRWSAAHSRRGATTRGNEEFNERTPWSIKVRTAHTPAAGHDGVQYMDGSVC